MLPPPVTHPHPPRVAVPRALLVSALLASGLVGCERATPPAPVPPRLVTTASVSRGPALDRLVLLGDLRGEHEVAVFADVPEEIRTLHVREGQRVSAGDPIVTLEASLIGSDVAQAAAALEAAEAERERLRVDRDRVAPLVAREVLPRSQLEGLELSLRAADARVAQLAAGRRAASIRRGQTAVRAPTGDFVAGLSGAEGDVAVPQRPLCSLVELDRLKVQLQAVEADYVRVREGMEAVVHSPSLPGESRVGRVLSRSTVIDRISRTGTVEVLIDNADHLLRPGMVAQVAFVLDRREDVVQVPSRAVQMTTRTADERRAVVYLREGEHAVRREVELGRRYPDPAGRGETLVEIVSGLAGGEEVIVEGQHLLRDDAPIRVQESAPSSPAEPAAAPEASPSPEAAATRAAPPRERG